MLRSLYSGISGLRADQTMLDVTANNIANVNTTGFKASSVEFQDTLSQEISSAGLAQTYKGGTNPNQVGLGVRIAAVNVSQTQGSQENTGENLDTMISGDGYFVTTNGSQTLYTRNGQFSWDSQGRLSTADGSLVQGWTAAPDGSVATGLAPTTIQLPTGSVAPSATTTSATMAGNLPSDATVGTVISRDITVYDSDGSAKTLTAKYTAVAGANGTDWDYTVGDGTGTAATGVLHADGNGGLTSASDTTATTDGITVDMSGVTSFAGLTSAQFSKQNGQAAGTLLSVSMGSDGTLSGTFSNGSTIAIARLALATFTNPGGLEKVGDTDMRASLNSGTPQLGTAGAPGFGTVVAGALEASNVDLSQEFTNLIIAQRGFEANARIITTSDQVLQDLVQLKQ